LERRYPSFGNLVPRDVAARNIKAIIDEGLGVGPQKNGVFLDFADAIKRLGAKAIEERYGNLFAMYEKITGEDPYTVPMRIYPAPHYTMGGLWVDYNLMTNVTGLYALGEANFSDHGANRLGASALMQGLADGYFVIPYTIGDYLAGNLGQPLSTETDAFRRTEAEVVERIRRMLSINGKRSPDSFHRELGRLVWDYCGIARNAAGLKEARQRIAALREEFWSNLRILGGPEQLNQELEKAGRVSDFFELAELMCIDALDRDESCGGHLRDEHQTPEGEALREDKHFSYVAAWEWTGAGKEPTLHREPLEFEYVKPSQRSYK
ncbi:MAG: FAD-binding protein, partial [Thermoanaerobaculia bacterium]